MLEGKEERGKIRPGPCSERTSRLREENGKLINNFSISTSLNTTTFTGVATLPWVWKVSEGLIKMENDGCVVLMDGQEGKGVPGRGNGMDKQAGGFGV